MATSKKPADGGAKELQAAADEAAAKGYIGTTPDPFPNEAYSLQSGPDSPTAAEVRAAVTGSAAADATPPAAPTVDPGKEG